MYYVGWRWVYKVYVHLVHIFTTSRAFSPRGCVRLYSACLPVIAPTYYVVSCACGWLVDLVPVWLDGCRCGGFTNGTWWIFIDCAKRISQKWKSRRITHILCIVWARATPPPSRVHHNRAPQQRATISDSNNATVDADTGWTQTEAFLIQISWRFCSVLLDGGFGCTAVLDADAFG